MELFGATYDERVNDQVQKWVEGHSIHNKIDNECCPDFSCCNTNYAAPMDKRQEYLKLFLKHGHDGVIHLLGEFLQNAMQSSGLQEGIITTRIIGTEPPGNGNCAYCQCEFELADLRPYGKNGELICYDCGMKPENRETTDKRFMDPLNFHPDNAN